MKRIWNIILLDFLWLLCSLPLISIGASTCAAYYVGLKLADGEEINIAKTFFKGFKDNFVQGTIFWIIDAVLLCGAYYLWFYSQADFSLVKMALLIGGTVLVLILTVYTYPLIARYKNSLFNILRNAFGLGLLYLVQTLIICAVLAGFAYFIHSNLWFAIPTVLVVPVVLIVAISKFARIMFQKIENNEVISTPAQEEESDETSESETESESVEEETDASDSNDA